MRPPRLSRLHCIYCGEPATTRDHVPPKFLLDKPFPPNLQTVPSCMACNNGASLDEQYFLVLLAHIASSPSIEAKLARDGLIDRTFNSSPALEAILLKALEVDDETGHPVIKPDMHRITRIIQKVAFGLFVLRYGRVSAIEKIEHVALYPYKPKDQRPSYYLMATFTERFQPKQWHNIQTGSFSYIFVRDPRHSGRIFCIMDIFESLWGVAHLPNPRNLKTRRNGQLQLFSKNPA